MNRRMSSLAIAAVIGSLALSSVLGTASERAWAAETRETVLSLDGMTCASCVFAVKSTLRKLDGVEDAKVSYREKRAAVTYDPDRVTPETLVEAVRRAGFKAAVVGPAKSR